MKHTPCSSLALFLVVIFLSACGPAGSVTEESNDASFERGRSYLKVGRELEALDEFLSVTRRVVQAPKSHLESGRLLLTLPARKDPVAAIYHFRRYLLLEPNSRESSLVEQLIVTAEREIIRKLPGEPYENYLESLELKEENDRLKREIADLQARLGTHSVIQSVVSEPAPLGGSDRLDSIVAQESIPDKLNTYVVKPGDSLYAISKKIYGDASYINAIYAANRDKLKSKNSLKVGQSLVLPARR